MTIERRARQHDADAHPSPKQWTIITFDSCVTVRCLARSARKVEARPWSEDRRVESVEVDVRDEQATAAALDGGGAAYYLVHS